MLFSEYFKLNHTQPQLDFVDIPVNTDINLFVDPYSFSNENSAWEYNCHLKIISFFESAIEFIRNGDDTSAKRILKNLSEPFETHLGVSRAGFSGRGVGIVQALDIYDKLANSAAIQSGLLSDLSECELMIEGIGPDKISDITINIIRENLVEYTQEQCNIYDIPTVDFPVGLYWDMENSKWKTGGYQKLPEVKFTDGTRTKIILVPKKHVRYKPSLFSQEYYNRIILYYLQQEHLSQGSALVETLKKGRKRVTKTKLKEEYPYSKEYLRVFSEQHPKVLEDYKNSKKNVAPITNQEMGYFDERDFSQFLINELSNIPTGTDDASLYHKFMVGVLVFLFYPDLITPKVEFNIHNGRKRIDIAYVNNALSGFFYRLPNIKFIPSSYIIVECKNYSKDPKNPELDQLQGRFSVNRGTFGILLARNCADKGLMIERCRDTAQDGRGFIIPLFDDDIIAMLNMVEASNRSGIDKYLEDIFQKLVN